MSVESTSTLTGLRVPADVLTDACVVIVDDHQASAALLEWSLRLAGVSDIHTVTDPREAVAYCLEFDADLVLLDLHMPGMDGDQVLAELRASVPDGEFLPVLVVTADTSVAARNMALAAGANDFLTKPLDPTEAVLRVQNLLGVRALHTELLDSREQHRVRQHTILQVAAEVTGDLDFTALARTIVDGVTAVTEFGVAVLTLRAGDGFERVAASGVDEPRIGLRTARSQWQALLKEQYRRGSLCYLIPPDELAGESWMQTVETPRPARRPFDDRDVWTPDHGLVLELLDDTGDWAGFLSVDAPSTGMVPDDDTLELLELFARQAQVGLENSRLFARVRRERDVADALRTVGDALASSVDLDETLQRCCDAVLHRSVGERASIYLHDPTSGEFRAVMNRGGGRDAVLWRAFREMRPLTVEDTPVFAEVMRTGAPVLIGRVAAPVHVRQDALELFALKSLAAYPLRSGDVVVGALVVDSHSCHVDFPEAELDLVAGIAGQAGVAIHRAGLHDEARRHANRVSTLHELTKEMTRTFDFDAIFSRIAEATPGDTVALVQLDQDHLRVLRSNVPRGGPTTRSYDVPREALPTEIWEQLAGRRHVLVTDVHGTAFEALTPPGARSLLVASHQSDDGGQLMLALTSENPDGFDADDAAFAEGLVEVAALAQRNALLYSQVKQAAERDTLTGMKNRRMYQAEVTPWLTGASPAAPVAMAVLDIDDFKSINDHHGHDIGDEVLIHVADRLRRSLRETDDVYRIGGEEFVVVMPGADAADAATVTDRIRRNVAITRKDLPATTVSIGVAISPHHGTDTDALFRAADQALYRAKAAGKNAVRIAGS